MTLEKAIELLNFLIPYVHSDCSPDDETALKLAIDALKKQLQNSARRPQ